MGNSLINKVRSVYYLNPYMSFARGLELTEVEKGIRGLPLDKPILDLGCGNGLVFWALFGKGKEYDFIDTYSLPFLDNNDIPSDPHQSSYIGIDINLDVLKSAKKLNLYKALLRCDASCLPFADDSVGTVFSNCVMEHIPDLNSCLSELGRIVKKDGMLIFTVPSEYFDENLFFVRIARGLGMVNLAKRIARKKNERLAQIHLLSIKEWEVRLKENGFSVKTFRYYLPPRAEMFWDFLCISTELGIGKFTLIGAVKKVFSILDKRKIKVQKRALIWIQERIFRFFSTQNSPVGGLILIVAQKNGGEA